jgi:hypothetical protein
MGTDCAPKVANLHLFFYELEFILNTRTSNYGLCLALRRIFRYIDDITAINDHGSFEANISNIYPASLELSKVNQIDSKADVLDVSVNINNNKFTTKLYDKRAVFDFDTNSFPHSNSNLPRNMLYNCFGSQIIRYFRICSGLIDFQNCTKALYHKLLSKNYDSNRLKNAAKKFFRKNHGIAVKYNISETFFLAIFN